MYWLMEPFGPEIESLRSGIIASTVANCNRGKGTQPYKPQDFMPQTDRPAGQTMEETKSKMNQAMAFLKQRSQRKKPDGE